jgi:hypothetical protein
MSALQGVLRQAQDDNFFDSFYGDNVVLQLIKSFCHAEARIKNIF